MQRDAHRENQALLPPPLTAPNELQPRWKHTLELPCSLPQKHQLSGNQKRKPNARNYLERDREENGKRCTLKATHRSIPVTLEYSSAENGVERENGEEQRLETAPA